MASESIRCTYLGYTIILRDRDATIITPGGAKINAGQATFSGIRRIIRSHRTA